VQPGIRIISVTVLPLDGIYAMKAKLSLNVFKNVENNNGLKGNLMDWS